MDSQRRLAVVQANGRRPACVQAAQPRRPRRRREPIKRRSDRGSLLIPPNFFTHIGRAVHRTASTKFHKSKTAPLMASGPFDQLNGQQKAWRARGPLVGEEQNNVSSRSGPRLARAYTDSAFSVHVPKATKAQKRSDPSGRRQPGHRSHARQQPGVPRRPHPSSASGSTDC